MRRNWAPSHRNELIGYIKAYIAAVTWLYDPANKAQGLAIFEKHLPGASAGVAAHSYAVFLDPNSGFDRKASIDVAGVKTVLQIREEYALPHKTLSEPAHYYDLSYYDAVKQH